MRSLQQSWSSKSLQQMHQGGLLRQGVPEGRLEGAQEDLPRRLSKEELDFLTSWYFWFSKRFGRKCCINVFKFKLLFFLAKSETVMGVEISMQFVFLYIQYWYRYRVRYLT